MTEGGNLFTGKINLSVSQFIWIIFIGIIISITLLIIIVFIQTTLLYLDFDPMYIMPLGAISLFILTHYFVWDYVWELGYRAHEIF